MTTELIKREITPAEVFVQNGLDMIISGIQMKKSEFEQNQFDITKKTDREKISSFAYQITRSKTYVDGKGKEYVAELKKKTKEIDAERKRFRDIMDDMAVEVKKPVTEWKEKEAARIEAERQLEIYFMDWDEALEIDDLFNREREIRCKEEEIARIEAERKAKEDAERKEREAKEREERLKKEAEERAAREYEEKIKAEKERAERLEREAKEAAEKAERDRIAAEEKAKREQEEAVKRAQEAAAEQARQEKEAEEKRIAAKKAKAEKIAANKQHRAKINNTIKAQLVEIGLSEELAKAVIFAVVKGKIERMEIRY